MMFTAGNYSHKFAVLALGLLGMVSGWTHVPKTNLQSIIDGHDIVLVAFVLPWTEASKALEPEWISAASQTDHPLISIDCSLEASFCDENDVTSYPAIRLFKGSHNMIRYRGSRKASSIIQFIFRSTLPPISTLDSKNRTSFESIDSTVFIAYLHPSDTSLKSAFATLAARYHLQYTFGMSFTEPRNNITSLPHIVCYKPNEGEKEVLSLSPQAGIDEIEKFMEASTAPLIGEITRRNEMKYLKAGKSLIYIFSPSTVSRSGYQLSLKPVAKKYREYLNIVTVDATEYPAMASMLGLKPNVWPAMAVQNTVNGQVFPFDQSKRITTETVEGFVVDIAQGRVKPGGNGMEKGTAKDEL